mgnify:CR=1 FL=1
MNEDEGKVVSLSGAKNKSKEKNTEKNETKTFEPVYCSFCGRPNTQVVKMVQGPGVNICSECTMIAVQYLILDDRMPSGEAQKILDLFWSKI